MKGEPPQPEQPEDRTRNMSFLDHLEELRWRIIKGLLGLAGGMVVAFIFSDFFVNTVMLGPTQGDYFIYDFLQMEAVDLTLQSRKLPGQFFTYWGTLIVVGGIIGSPVLFYQLWAFIEPALESGEKWKSRLNTLFITSFFLMGVAFGYFILVPFALQFFTKFQISEVIHNDFDINEYFSSVAMWVLSCGVIFQLPVVSYFLSKFGLLTPDFLRKYRRHAIVTCFILAAFLTPPDPVSQFLIVVPLLLLFQLAVWLSKIATRKRKEEIEDALGSDIGE